MTEFNTALPFNFECSIRHKPLKRIFDVLFSAALLFFGLPVFCMIALMIRVTSKGSSVYSHERIGRGGKVFRCFKFRTMYADADLKLQELLEKNPTLKMEWELCRKLKNDPRITPIGRFLRKTSLDELPQFWNVLRGDLSIVGPRPVVLAEIGQYYGQKASKILSVRPGITGLWQVSGRNDTTYHTRVRLDEEYVDNHSFILDLKLVLKTIPSMIFSKGAY